jgi:hypothetical protein
VVFLQGKKFCFNFDKKRFGLNFGRFFLKANLVALSLLSLAHILFLWKDENLPEAIFFFFAKENEKAAKG